MELNEIKKQFVKTYGEGEIRVFTSPGRVNLIGEHIDYCGGCVMPAALTMRTTIIARKRDDEVIRLKATDLDFVVETTVSEMHNLKDKLKWGDYQIGVMLELMKVGYDICGCDLLYDDTVPHGGGLSSSAAIEVSTALCFATFSNEKKGIDKEIDMIEMALISQRAEHNFIGVKCGIMDQFASAMGKKDCAIFLNTADLSYEYAPLVLEDAKIVVTNSKVKHSLVGSEYNVRRTECETALKELQTVVDIQGLGDLSEEEFEKYKFAIKDSVRVKRAKHAVYENQRTIKAVNALKQNDIESFGKLMNASHVSLRDDYAVSCDEIDVLVEEAWKIDGVVGSRITGGGFGGCTVSIVKNDAVEEFKEKLGAAYKTRIGKEADFYIVEIGEGPCKL